MKTVLLFEDSFDKRKVILKHHKKIQIKKEIRKDVFEWRNSNDELIENRNFIVISFPKNKGIDFQSFKLRKHDAVGVGFQMNDLGNEIELLFYDRITFTWNLYELERIGLFSVTQRIVPTHEGDGELFSFYVNARSVNQYGYNLIFMFIQFLIKTFKKKKLKENRKEV